MTSAAGSNGRYIAGVDLRLIDNVTGGIKKIIGLFPGLEKAGKAASKAFQLGANLKQAAEGVQGFGSDVASALKKPIQTFMQFEDSMARVGAATFGRDFGTAAAQKEFSELQKTARQLGATTKFSASEAGAGLEILATQGFKARQQIEAMPGLLDLAAASNESIATATDIATATMNQFGLAAKDVGGIGDILVATSDATSVNLTELGESLKYAGAEAHKAGTPLKTAAAMVGALGNFGIKGSQAGTAIRSIFSGLSAPTKQGKSALDFLGIKTKDKAGNLKPVEELLAEMQRAMDRKFGEGKGGARRAALFKAVFGQESKAAAAILAEQAKSGDLSKLIQSNAEAAGSAARKAAILNSTALGSSKSLASAYEELQLVIGETLIPRVVELLKWANETINSITAWAKANPELVNTIGKIAGALALTSFVLGPVLKGFTLISSLVGIASSVLGVLGSTIGVVTSALRVMTAVAIANPVGALVTAIAVSALLLYKYWEPISAFFSNLWEGVTNAFKVATEWIFRKIEWAVDKVGYLKDWATGRDYDAEIQAGNETTEGLKKTSALFADDDEKFSVHGRLPVAPTTSPIASGLGDAAGRLKDLMAGMPSLGAQGAPMSFAAQGAPLMPELTSGSGSMPSLPAQQFDGKLQIEIRGADVASTNLKTNANPGFNIQVRTGSQ